MKHNTRKQFLLIPHLQTKNHSQPSSLLLKKKEGDALHVYFEKDSDFSKICSFKRTESLNIRRNFKLCKSIFTRNPG